MQREPLASIDEAKELPGGAVAQGGTGPASEDGGEPASLLGDQRVADRVDAPVKAVQVAGHDPPLHLIRAQADLQKLAQRDDAVLTTGPVGDLRRQ